MNKIAASKFKEKCLAILDNMDQEGYVITKHGKPVARIVPYESSPGQIGRLKGKIKIKGDIFSTGIKWNAQS
jgi:prevent-host-death family protein